MIDWDTLRDAYIDNFVSLDREEPKVSADGSFYVLRFWLPDAVGKAYATFGASGGALGHEIVVVSTVWLPAFDAAVEAAARDLPGRLAPYAVFPVPIPGTCFEALFFLPPGEETFALREEGGAPFAFRAVPITSAERELASRAPAELVAALRRADALVADPFRDCVVALPPPRRTLKPEIAALRRRARQAAVQIEQGMRRNLPARYDDTSKSSLLMEAVRVSPLHRPSILLAVQAILVRALDPFARGIPPRAAELCGEVLYVTIATHPDAVRLMGRILDPFAPTEAPRASGAGDASQAAVAKVTADVAVAVGRFHREPRPGAFALHTKKAVAASLKKFDASDEIPIENHCWAEALIGVYEALPDLPEPRAALLHAIRVLAHTETLLELDPDPRPPLVRLRDIVGRIAIGMFTAYAYVVSPEKMPRAPGGGGKGARRPPKRRGRAVH